MRYACLDTSVWSHHLNHSWAKEASNIEKDIEANQILEYLLGTETIIVIPSVVLFEVESPLEDERARLFHQTFIENFNMQEFCSDAAHLAARIFKKAGLPFNPETWACKSKSLIKSDCMIMATMLKLGIYDFYTFDTDYKKIQERSGDLLSKMHIMEQLEHAQMEVILPEGQPEEHPE